MPMSSCWKCASPVEADDRFCDSCGANQAEAPTAPAVTDATARVEERRHASETEAGSETSPVPVMVAVEESKPESEPVPERAAMTPETVAVAELAPLLIDPVEPIGALAPGSVHDAVEGRRLLWTDVDGAAALLHTIETAAKPAAGTVAGTVEAHARLTSGIDLLAELRSIETELRNEVQAIAERDSKVTANEAEIARLNRNRMIMIGSVIAGVIFVIILIASAL